MFLALMQADIQKTIDSGKLTSAAGRAVAKLGPGTYVMHKSWGFGQVAELDFLLGQITINFRGKKKHQMQMQYAADSLTVVPVDHILAQKASDLSRIKAMTKSDVVGLMRIILRSLGGKATQDQIAATLVPEVLTESEFKRWIENAKKSVASDGHIIVPRKKALPFELRDEAISHADEFLIAFNAARQVKHQIEALDRIVKHIDEFSDPARELQPVIAATDDTGKKSAKLHTSDALILLLTRDELIEKVPQLQRGLNSPTVRGVLVDEQRNLPTLVNAVPAAKMKRVLAELPAAFGPDWPARAVSLVLRGSFRVVSEAAQLLIDQGKVEELRAALSRAVSEHSISSEALRWLCAQREGAFCELANVHLFRAIIAAIERDQMNEKKDRKLQDVLLGDQELIGDLIADATLEELRDIIRKLLATQAFDEVNKRSILGRILRVYPELQSMVEGGESGTRGEALIVSWESLERRKAEFDELVNKRIPANVKEISIARSYGDLRENAEFKAAKEMQRVLNRRRAETERDLSLARGTDFTNVDTSQAGIGTVVTVRNVASGETDVYTLLGAWDTDPERGVISYKSALAQALMGKKVGDQLKAPTEQGERIVEIIKIEAFRAAAVAA